MSLSPGEQAVCNLLLKGFSNREISRCLGVTEKTVKFHLTKIFAKKNVTTRAELIVAETDERPTLAEVQEFIKLLG
jgi:DNA-binding NarL/FixJ family response regulator